MAVRLRLQRYGSTHRPFYRLVAAESTRARNGKFLSLIGTYDPSKSDVKVDVNELNRWYQNGALPTDTVRSLLRKHKIELSKTYKVVYEKKEVKPVAVPVKKKVTKTAPKKETTVVKPTAEAPKKSAQPAKKPASKTAVAKPTVTTDKKVVKTVKKEATKKVAK